MSEGYGAGFRHGHLYVYWAPVLGVWVAQCEQPYIRPWTYASEKGWEQAMHQGLAHLYMHPRDRISSSVHSGGDELTSTNGRITNPAPGTYRCRSVACSYAWEYDGNGTWVGPTAPRSIGEYARPMTGWELSDSYADCARSVLGAL